MEVEEVKVGAACRIDWNGFARNFGKTIKHRRKRKALNDAKRLVILSPLPAQQMAEPALRNILNPLIIRRRPAMR